MPMWLKFIISGMSASFLLQVGTSSRNYDINCVVRTHEATINHGVCHQTQHDEWSQASLCRDLLDDFDLVCLV